MSSLPWFLPVVALAAVTGIILSGPLGRALEVRRLHAWALVIGVAVILAATLTPLRSAVEDGLVGPGACDLSTLTPPRPSELLTINESSLNVLLFVPLGIVVGLLQRPRPRAGVLVAALALPFAIEGVQSLATVLGRGCQSADVIDNLIGLALGFAVAMLLRWTGTAAAKWVHRSG